MKEIGMNKISDMALEHIDGKMGQFILDIGLIMLLMDMESYYMRMAISMKVIGKMIKLMVMENIHRKMELFTKANG